MGRPALCLLSDDQVGKRMERSILEFIDIPRCTACLQTGVDSPFNIFQLVVSRQTLEQFIQSVGTEIGDFQKVVTLQSHQILEGCYLIPRILQQVDRANRESQILKFRDRITSGDAFGYCDLGLPGKFRGCLLESFSSIWIRAANHVGTSSAVAGKGYPGNGAHADIGSSRAEQKVMTVQQSKSHPQENNRNGWQPIPIPFPYSFAKAKNSHTLCQPLMKG